MTIEVILGLVMALFWLLYLGQVVSVLNLNLARRLGLQERAEDIDPQYQRDTAYTARWDILSMWVLPLGGILMLLDHALWSVLSMIGGALYLDTGARQFVKLRALKTAGVRVGAPPSVSLAYGVYAAFIVVGLLAIGAGLAK